MNVASGATFSMDFSNTINGLNDLGGGGGTVLTQDATSVVLTVGDGDADGAFSGAIVSTTAGSTVGFKKMGTGTQVLSGSNSYNGQTVVSDGKLTISGTHSGAGTYSIGNVVGQTGTLDLNSGSNVTTSGASSFIQVGDGGTGIVNQSGGTITVANVNAVSIVGNTSNGTWNQTGGTFNPGKILSIGQAGVMGSYVLSAGQVNSTGNLQTIEVGSLGNGQFDHSGTGVVHTGILQLGVVGAGSSGTYEISGGSLNVNLGFEVGRQGTGIVNQSGGTVTVFDGTSGGDMALGLFAGSNGTYNLSGGNLNAVRIFGVSGATGAFNFTGGTLRVGSFNDPVLAGDLGGLTQSEDINPSLLDVTGNDTAITGDYNLLEGKVDIGATQTLIVSDDVTLSSGTTWNVQYDGDLEDVGFLSVAGELNIEGAILNLFDANIGELLDGPSYLIAQAADGIFGTPTITGSIDGYFVDISTNQITLQAVPEPGSLILMTIGAIGIGAIVRHRRK